MYNKVIINLNFEHINEDVVGKVYLIVFAVLGKSGAISPPSESDGKAADCSRIVTSPEVCKV